MPYKPGPKELAQKAMRIALAEQQERAQAAVQKTMKYRRTLETSDAGKPRGQPKSRKTEP